MQERISRILIILILLTILLPSSVIAQVVIERSKDKVIISGKPYYIHIVKKGETSYSISKAYGITVDQLVKDNPSASKGIKDGQSLRLPVVDNSSKPAPPTGQKIVVQRDESRYIYHKLSKGDTVYSLAKKYGVSEDEILQSNPGVEINKLPVNAEIAIPKRQFTTTTQNLDVPEKDYITYKVVKGESITSIAEKFGVTVREIRKENRGMIFPKVDEEIRIPVSRIAGSENKPEAVKDTVKAEEEISEEDTEQPEGYTAVGELRGKYNIAVMLPMYYPENAIRSEIDLSQTVKGKPKELRRQDSWIYDGTLPFLELYQGILIAADTLRSKGLDVNVYLYDIKEDTSVAVRLIESDDLEKMDLIIGPVYSKNLSIVAEYGSEKDIPVVSPVPLWSNSVVTGKPYLFMAIPSLEVAQEAISKQASDYSSSNFVFIHSDTLRNDESVTAFKNMIFRELTGKIPFEEIRFKEFLYKNRSSLSNDSINRLEHALSSKGDNTVIIASEDPSVLSESIMDLHTFTRNYQIKFIGYPRVRELVNLDPRIFFELGLELYTPYWIDYNEDDIRAFNRTYRKKFLTEPAEESFAWEGYDITYYFISGLAIHGKRFLRRPEIHNPDLLQTEYEFIRLGDDNGLENHKLYHIRYTPEMDIMVINEVIPADARDKK
jgi:LysM repeat protein